MTYGQTEIPIHEIAYYIDVWLRLLDKLCTQRRQRDCLGISTGICRHGERGVLES